MKRLLLILSFILLPYQLVFGAAADMAVTVTGAGDGTGTKVDGVTCEWDNAMSYGQWHVDLEGSAEAGDRYFVAGGTYTLSIDLDPLLDGTAASFISVIGVVSGTTAEPPTTADWAYGTDRPLIAAGAREFMFDNYWLFRNIRVTTTDSDGFRVDVFGKVINCYASNTSGTKTRPSFMAGGTVEYVNCEAEGSSRQASGFTSGSSSSRIDCYAHDLDSGFLITHNAKINGCIAYDCLRGIYHFAAGAVAHSCFITNNTIYKCTTGIDIKDSQDALILNNIIDTCTTGVSTTDASYIGTIYLDYNCWNGNTADTANVVWGVNRVEADPLMTDPDSEDFTLQSGSPCLDTGSQLTTGEGVVGDYKWNIGADQDDNAAAGGAVANGAVSMAY